MCVTTLLLTSEILPIVNCILTILHDVILESSKNFSQIRNEFDFPQFSLTIKNLN